MEHNEPSILHSKYPGDAWSQGISSHHIELLFSEHSSLSTRRAINSLRPRQNVRHFPDDILKCIFLNENISIAIEISLKFVPKGPISNIVVLFQIMAWRRPGDKPLSEPMIIGLSTHICITRPQWVNSLITIPLHWNETNCYNSPTRRLRSCLCYCLCHGLL